MTMSFSQLAFHMSSPLSEGSKLPNSVLVVTWLEHPGSGSPLSVGLLFSVLQRRRGATFRVAPRSLLALLVRFPPEQMLIYRWLFLSVRISNRFRQFPRHGLQPPENCPKMWFESHLFDLVHAKNTFGTQGIAEEEIIQLWTIGSLLVLIQRSPTP